MMAILSKPKACPRCGQLFEPDVRARLSLPPTGGDYEWCESRQTVRCPACAAELIATVRTWLDDRSVEVLSLEAD
jgi:predicted Zn-ribbon and HTH transcriptional regulator